MGVGNTDCTAVDTKVYIGRAEKFKPSNSVQQRAGSNPS